MRVNDKKTQLLCICASTNSNTDSYIQLWSGEKIKSQDSLKQLGFYFSCKPGAQEHIDHVKKKVRERFWILRHMKKAGTSCDNLVALYKCFILPLIYYSSVVYHSLLTSGQADSIENLQATAIKIIYGYSKSDLKILEQHSKKLECLHDRRERLFDKFVLKASVSNKN